MAEGYLTVVLMESSNNPAPVEPIPEHKHPHYIKVRAIAGYITVLSVGFVYIYVLILSMSIPWQSAYGAGCSQLHWREVNNSEQALTHFFWNPSAAFNQSAVVRYEYGVCYNLTWQDRLKNASYNTLPIR